MFVVVELRKVPGERVSLGTLLAVLRVDHPNGLRLIDDCEEQNELPDGQLAHFVVAPRVFFCSNSQQRTGGAAKSRDLDRVAVALDWFENVGALRSEAVRARMSAQLAEALSILLHESVVEAWPRPAWNLAQRPGEATACSDRLSSQRAIVTSAASRLAGDET